MFVFQSYQLIWWMMILFLEAPLPDYPLLNIKSILALRESFMCQAQWLINFQNLKQPMLLSGLLEHNDLTVPECNTTLSTSCLLLSNVTKLISCQTGTNTLQTHTRAHTKCQNEQRKPEQLEWLRNHSNPSVTWGNLSHIICSLFKWMPCSFQMFVVPKKKRNVGFLFNLRTANHTLAIEVFHYHYYYYYLLSLLLLFIIIIDGSVKTKNNWFTKLLKKIKNKKVNGKSCIMWYNTTILLMITDLKTNSTSKASGVIKAKFYHRRSN